uniref:Kinesin protein n=1 Tax=Echinococcus granulosus TaxID=6210 RepID=A0A068WNY2_ECHGR|nr:kinesin protein [Echinococcus granulosus]
MAKSSILKSRKQQSVQTDDLPQEKDSFQPLPRRNLPTNFSQTILLSPPIPLPQTNRKSPQSSHHSKAKLVLVYETRDSCGKPIDQPSLTTDEAEKQVRLIRPAADASPAVGGISNAPKNFPSDGAFSDQDSMKDFCTAVLSDQISVVVNGSDGCVIYLNPVGKRDVSRFVGNDATTAHFGLIPTAIQWLFNALKDQCPTPFYLTVSAAEVCIGGSKSSDLLSESKNSSDSDGRRLEELKSGIFAWKRPFSPHVEDDTTELVAATMVDAAHYLDVALGASRRLHESATTTTTPGHLFFTLNVYRNHSSGTVTTPIVKPQGSGIVHDKCVEIQMPPCRRCGIDLTIEKSIRRMEQISVDVSSPSDLYVSDIPTPTARCSRRYQKSMKKETINDFGFAENLSTRPRFPRFIKDAKHIQCRHCKDEVDRIALMEFLRLEHECEMQGNTRRKIVKTRKEKNRRKIGEPLTHSTPLKTSPLPCRDNHSA